MYILKDGVNFSVSSGVTNLLATFDLQYIQLFRKLDLCREDGLLWINMMLYFEIRKDEK